MNQPKFYIGVDWASEKHDVWLTDAICERLGYKIFPHSGESLNQMCEWIAVTAGVPSTEIAVGIEVPHGPVVETLLERGFVVHAINPKQLDRLCDRFTMAGAKDDSRDAETMASALRTHRHAFRKLAIADPTGIELREWSRMRTSRPSARASPTACASRFGATFRRCSRSKAMSRRRGCSIFEWPCRHPRRPRAYARARLHVR